MVKDYTQVSDTFVFVQWTSLCRLRLFEFHKYVQVK